MNKKGEIGIGVFLVAFVGIIVALVLFQSVSQFVGGSTTTGTNTEVSYDSPTSSAEQTLLGQELLSTATVVNESGNVNCANNFTIAEGVSTTTGTKRVLITAIGDTSRCDIVNISYNYAPEGYIDDAGGRGVALLIPILAALAIFVIALVPSLRSGVLELMRGK